MIPTYNSAGVIGACLRSLPPGLAVIVADNASSDATVAIAKTARPDARILQRQKNDGFGMAANAGWHVAQTGFVVFVNPDLEVQEGTFGTVMNVASSDPNISILGSPDAKGDAPRLSEPFVDAEMVSGAFFAVRRNLFPAGDLFDPAFFLYFEDYDVCVRARSAGRRVVLVRDAAVRHAQGQSTTGAFDNGLEKAWLWGASCQYFASKHRSTADADYARSRVNNYLRRSWLQRWWRRDRPALLNEARADGARAVVRYGPETMRENGFTNGTWRTARLTR